MKQNTKHETTQNEMILENSTRKLGLDTSRFARRHGGCNSLSTQKRVQNKFPVTLLKMCVGYIDMETTNIPSKPSLPPSLNLHNVWFSPAAQTLKLPHFKCLKSLFSAMGPSKTTRPGGFAFSMRAFSCCLIWTELLGGCTHPKTTEQRS